MDERSLENLYNKPMKKLLILFFLICSQLQAGTVYYISPTGNNAASGTINEPWQTLRYACSMATALGDVIHVMPGTYNESSTSNLAVGVSIEGEVGSIIRSTITSTYTISLSSSNSNTNGNQHISGIRLQSNTLYTAYAGIGIINRGNVEIYDCEIADFNYYAIALHNGEQTGRYAVNNSIHNCVITNSSGYINGDSKGSLNILSQDGLRIYDNTISVNRLGGANGNCIDGVEGFIKNMKVYNNTLIKTMVVGTTAWDFAIEIWNWEGGNERYIIII